MSPGKPRNSSRSRVVSKSAKLWHGVRVTVTEGGDGGSWTSCAQTKVRYGSNDLRHPSLHSLATRLSFTCELECEDEEGRRELAVRVTDARECATSQNCLRYHHYVVVQYVFFRFVLRVFLRRFRFASNLRVAPVSIKGFLRTRK